MRTMACLVFLLSTSLTLAQSKEQKTVLFVCEHGSAKSIVAASHFSRLAKKEGLNVLVVPRGTNPDKAVPQKINQILVDDGFEKYAGIPQKLSVNDLSNADYVVAFCPLPEELGKTNNVETWNVPSFEAGYPIARDSILVNSKRLIDKIKSANKK